MAPKRRRPAESGSSGDGDEQKERATPERPDKRARVARGARVAADEARRVRPSAPVGDTKREMAEVEVNGVVRGEVAASANASPERKSAHVIGADSSLVGHSLQVKPADVQLEAKSPRMKQTVASPEEKSEQVKQADATGKVKSPRAKQVDATEEMKSPRVKRAETPRRVKRARATSPPPSTPRAVSRPVKLRRTASTGAAVRVHEDEQEEKPRAALRVSTVRLAPAMRVTRMAMLDGDDIPKENREEGRPRPACRNLGDDLRREDARTPRKESEDASRVALLRSTQVTPPPSARMLDKRNPPPPPPRPKSRRHFHRSTGVTYVRPFPRLALSPLVDSPPSSPTSPQRVFRSLADDFMAAQDTPQQAPRPRPEPQMARGSRRSGRSANARRSIDTPTSTMVLRSRQLNHNAQPSIAKPENAREREQREFHERERRGT